VLEEISASSLAKWRAAGRNLEQLSEILFFGLEARRNHHSAELLDAVRKSAEGAREFTGWSRLVDYQYSTQPLSMAGSVRGDGGRFNIGGGLNAATHTPFPALYVAEDLPTAFRERFGIDPAVSANGLSADELVLRAKGVFHTPGADLQVGIPDRCRQPAGIETHCRYPLSHTDAAGCWCAGEKARPACAMAGQNCIQSSADAAAPELANRSGAVWPSIQSADIWTSVRRGRCARNSLSLGSEQRQMLSGSVSAELARIWVIREAGGTLPAGDSDPSPGR